MSIERRVGRPGPAGASLASSDSASAVGKRALTEGLHVPRSGDVVQRKERPAAGDAPDASQTIASAGVRDGGGPLPFGNRIQALFGRHDISGISAHVDGDASAAAEQLGATAYATGNHVAFAGTPDLHTAAHEAAHVVQQRAGVALSRGVGTAGDQYERNADAVADRVVAGESAEDLLETAEVGTTRSAVQRRERPDIVPLVSTSDWHTGDRTRLGGSFEVANLRNLAANDHAQYSRIEERRDFYRWFYNYSAALGCTTRWALAASLVANGAHQVAHMDRVWRPLPSSPGRSTTSCRG